MKIVIVGGSAGGASVAARLRRQNETAEIVIIEKGNNISFATCGIPYYMGDVIRDRGRLNVVEHEDFVDILNVDVRTNNEVLAINRKVKKILAKDNVNGKLYEESYDKLVLATGGNPIKPDIKGIDLNNVFTLRNAEDTDYAKQYIETNNCQNIVIVGAGFIGLELAENLRNKNINVHVIERKDQVMAAWDYEMAVILHHHIRLKSVNLILKDELKNIKNNKVVLKSGGEIPADAIFLCLGVKPGITLAREGGLKIGALDGIEVNPGMMTSDQNIYAVGDAVEVKHIISNHPTLIPLAGIAQRQARIVADNICGKLKAFNGAQGVSIVKVFDMAIGIAGLSECELQTKQITYKKSYIETLSLAEFYPDAFPMTIKLLFSANTGRLLGAQIVGSKGVDKRLDVLASAIQFEKTVYDLAELELAYAPPFSSAKDPVNLIGMTAVNMLEGDVKVVHWDEIDNAREQGAVLVDVRTNEEFEINSIKGAINIPLHELRNRLNELSFEQEVIVYCQQGKKGYFASRLLSQNGFHKVKNLSGGQKIYQLLKDEQGDSELFINKNVISDDVIAFIPTSAKQSISQSAVTTSPNFGMKRIDASGMSCPGPIMRLIKEIKRSSQGELIQITVTDPGFEKDVAVWAKKSENSLLQTENVNGKFTAIIRVNDVASKTINEPIVKQVPNTNVSLKQIQNLLQERPSEDLTNNFTIDACGMNCPGPILKLTKVARNVSGGDVITISATDTGFIKDISTWSDKKGFRVLNIENNSAQTTAILQKM